MAVAATLALAATGPTASGAALPKVSVKPLFTMTAGMLAPTDVAIGPDDWVYVLDGVNQRVRVFDANGRLVRSLGGFGGTGSMATGLAVSST
ncbi:MAG: hypothetical protein GXP62_07810, partial [Oligoflexia bacterium]|nr:hypothetical protein [Oligoflexia bacterium]